MIITWIVKSFDEDVDYYVPVAEIEKLENQHFDEITKAGLKIATDTLTHATAHAHEHGNDARRNQNLRILDLPDERLHSVLNLVCYLCRSGERHAGGPTGKDIFELPFVLVETFLLLFSSITYGMAAIAMYKTTKARLSPGWR